MFYEGHLPAFSVIALLKRGLGQPGVDAEMERLFERGIDPDSVDQAVPRSGAATIWPSRDEVLAFGRRADEAIVEALGRAELDLAGSEHRAMRRGEAIFTALEHEAMHQETLLYMWHRLPHDQKQAPRAGVRYERGGDPPPRATVTISAGIATLGADRAAIPFGWDNEFAEHRVEVDAFEIDVHNVTNAEFLEFIDAGGYRSASSGRRPAGSGASRTASPIRPSGFATRPMVLARDVRERRATRGVARVRELRGSGGVRALAGAEASDRARISPRRVRDAVESTTPNATVSRGATRHPMPRAAISTSRRGIRSLLAPARGAQRLGRARPGRQRLGVDVDCLRPFRGFEPMASYPEYSADFFDGQHYVIKGASPATARELVRRSFRNWFRPNYPFVYAKFRTALRHAESQLS